MRSARWAPPTLGRPAPAGHDRHGRPARPKLLLADRPTTALDVSLRGQILDLLEELRRRGRHGGALDHARPSARAPLCRPCGGRAKGPPGGAVRGRRLFNAPQHPYTKLMASRPSACLTRHAAAVPGHAPALAGRGYRVPDAAARHPWLVSQRGAFVALHGADFAIAADARWA